HVECPKVFRGSSKGAEDRLFDPAMEYKMSHKRRGIALIFNHERFFWHLTLPDRRGTSADRENLKRM
uniref:Caspase family p20 domain-containing protein n=1 Tax=Varanus komodoensis TaxID=61221 RepID=A0A8D2L037_VARKO